MPSAVSDPVPDIVPVPLTDADCQLQLRLLATSDLHAHLVPWDYFMDRPSEGTGLARVASLLHMARAEAGNTLYFDNGDLIEGSPLAEYALRMAANAPAPLHPMIAALNALNCDAATLGNHEFSYGMAFLRTTLMGAAYPIVSANILSCKGGTVAKDVPLFAPWVILDRKFADRNGVMQPLRVGVLGLTPPQVLDWEKAVLPATLQARGMVETAAHYLPLIRAAGADVVIALAHTGIGSGATYAQAGSQTDLENVGQQLLQLPGLHAVVLGHEHLVYPQTDGNSAHSGAGQSGAGQSGAAVMPGAYGSHLGVIDLDLVRGVDGWQVVRSRAECRPIARRGTHGQTVGLVPDDAAIMELAAPSHLAARTWMTQPVGNTAVPLHSYFAIAHPNAMQAMIAGAQTAHLATLVTGTQWEGLPILSAVAPFKTGGRGGPEHFTDVPAGPVLMRNAADLYVHPNRFAAVVMTGADVRQWLERAASTYAQVSPGGQDQALINPLFPATGLEMIAGLTYQIDLSAPARHVSPTAPDNAQPGRIRDLRFQGSPLQDSMRFALATNSHRMGVMMGQTAGWAPEVIADGTADLTSREVMLAYLSQGDFAAAPPLGWAFSPMPGTSVTVDTAPAALPHLGGVAHFRPENLGLTAEGFLRFRLHL